SNVLDNSAVESFTGIDRGNANDARINADHTFALRIGNVLCDDQMQIPDSTFAGDCGSRLDLLRPVEILSVIVGENQIDSHSTVERSQRGEFLIEFNRERPGVITHRGCFFPAMRRLFVAFVSLRPPRCGQSKQDSRAASSTLSRPDK